MSGTEKMLKELFAETIFRHFIRNSFILATNIPPSHSHRHLFINYCNALRVHHTIVSNNKQKLYRDGMYYQYLSARKAFNNFAHDDAGFVGFDADFPVIMLIAFKHRLQ